MMAKRSSNCVICYKQVEQGNTDHDFPPNEVQTDKLAAQLNVIFVLRNIFELKPKQLGIYLQKWGNPAEWVKFCKNCEDDVSNIRRIYERLHEVTREFERAKWNVQWKARRSEEERGDVGNRGGVLAPGVGEIMWECSAVLRRGKIGTEAPPPTSNPFPGKIPVHSNPELMFTAQANWKERVPITEVKEEVEDFNEFNSDCGDFDLETSSHALGPLELDIHSGDRDYGDCNDDGNRTRRNSTKSGLPEFESESESQTNDQECEKSDINKLCLPLTPNRAKISSRSRRRRRVKVKYNESESKIQRQKQRRPWVVKNQGTLIPCTIEGCMKTFRTTRALSAHVGRKHSNDIDWSLITLSEDKASGDCNLCGKHFAILRNLKVHIKNVHKKNVYLTCGECGKCCTSQVRLKLHLAMVHNIGAYFKCDHDECPKAFLTEKGLMDHKASTHSLQDPDKSKYEKKHFCEKCGATFKYACHLRYHMNSHADEQEEQNSETAVASSVNSRRGNQCHICGKYYSNERILDSHIKFVHEKKLPIYCDICQLGLHSKTHAVKHKARIHKIGDFKCVVEGCTKVFGLKKHYDDHVKHVHEGIPKVKNHFCQFCGKGFEKPLQKRTHEEALHINKVTKPFKCHVCEKSFSTANYRWYHLNFTHKIFKK